jgi:acyl-CoA hydrolase
VPDTDLVPLAPSASRLTLSQIMDQHHTNLMGTVHGGRILHFIDAVAGVVAARHSSGPAVTAAIDETVFLQAVRVGDVVHADGFVTWAGRSSMEVTVYVTADRWDRAVPPTTVATAHLVMVAVDDGGHPRAVPGLVLESETDQRKFAARPAAPRTPAGAASGPRRRRPPCLQVAHGRVGLTDWRGSPRGAGYSARVAVIGKPVGVRRGPRHCDRGADPSFCHWAVP